MRQRRTITTAVLALAMVLSSAAIAGAESGNDQRQTDHATVQTQQREQAGALDRVSDRARDQVSDRATDRATDRASDRATDRTTDRPAIRPVDCGGDGAADRPGDCRPDQRPDPDLIDRPTFKRCVNWLLENTDVNYGHNVRRWLWACHRLLAHFNQPL
jgi:hypothetical protein